MISSKIKKEFTCDKNKLFVVRHGKTDWNIKGLLQGSTEIELNEVGINQAKELAKILMLIK